MEEIKHAPLPTRGAFHQDDDPQLKARVNNNLPFQRACNRVYSTVSRLDQLAAYSLATGCPSYQRVKQTQINALVRKFTVPNAAVDEVEAAAR